ncbi:MAG TPA: hypothetical protein VK619_17735 [Pyrinomonadaceae bacterium]|nr:hypothetical protein [Pyrinomonadaceae bacterium]
MKQKMALLLIIVTLLCAPLPVNAAGNQKALTVDEVKARTVEAQASRREIIVRLRPGAKIFVGSKAFPYEIANGANLSGRVKAVGENDFTLSSASSRTGEVTAVINYADVLGVKHQSGVAKLFKNIGRYSLLSAASVVIIPLFAIETLLGVAPKC